MVFGYKFFYFIVVVDDVVYVFGYVVFFQYIVQQVLVGYGVQGRFFRCFLNCYIIIDEGDYGILGLYCYWEVEG